MADGHRPPAVILVRPREEGNLGAVARAMDNMGLDELIVVEPAAPAGETARAFAVGSAVLDRHRRVGSVDEAIAPFHRLVGTTSGRGRAGGEVLLAPRELPEILAADPPETRAALLFGPEVGGLDLEELARCHPLVRVPCAPAQPTLNLAQAVLIVAYELYLARLEEAAPAAAGAVQPPATRAELEGLFAHLEEALAAVGFARDDTFAGVLRDLRRLAARAAPNSREVTLLRGVCRRVLGALGHRSR